ncbi:alpha/beta hydrolase domain-containing protein [Arthrobacter ginkgonis]|uniref:Alpha/beta hydrolase domain-containing protein n=1 Tax=Arthrobacter ginkgonis TaxID=1630594 RepID=A0ABP7BNR8_9MICC
MPGLKIVHRTRTERSNRPFTSGWAVGEEHGVDLEEVGYVEDEFIVSGTQNTYTYGADWSRQVAQADLPYTTRVLVRRPAEASAASGVVVGESLHPGSANDSSWRGAHPWIIRKGHTWVGVTTAAGWARTMAESIDPARYGALSLPANGLGWGIMSDVVTALRAGAFEGLGPGAVSRLYLTGWSMTGTFCRVFLGDGFHAASRTPEGGPAVDGYLIGISSGGFLEGGYTPLSDGCPVLPEDDPRRTIGAYGVPVIELLSENESETHSGVLRPDSDDPQDPYRLYQVAGSGHSSYRPRTGWPGDEVALRHRRPATPIREQWSTFPLEFAARAAYEHLDRWVAEGTPAPRAERIPFAETGLRAPWPEARPLERDADCNAVGGVRSTYVDVPAATYVPHSTTADDADGQSRGWLYPHVLPFPDEVLLERYGSAENYRKLVARRAAELVGEGWLLEEEAALVVEGAALVDGARDVRFDSPGAGTNQSTNDPNTIQEVRA